MRDFQVMSDLWGHSSPNWHLCVTVVAVIVSLRETA